jgi:DNA-binding transcriptional LysR family regulator
VNLTKKGQEFLELCQNIVGQLEQGTTIIGEKDSEPVGTLKIVTGIGTSDTILENLPIFAQQFPNVDFIFLSMTEIYQFHIGDADIGIIPVCYSDSDIVQHILYESRLRIYASPSYLAKNTAPKNLEELKSHKLIVYGGSERALNEINIHLLQQPSSQNTDYNFRQFITVNNGLSLRRALITGLGIGPYEYDRELVSNNLLVDVFPDTPDYKIPYYFTYHRRLEGSQKVRAFHDFLKDVVKVWERPEKK